MQIKTEFEISDEVWYFKDSIPTKSEIKDVTVRITKTPKLNTVIKYTLMRDTVQVNEQSLFRTQRDLYASLED